MIRQCTHPGCDKQGMRMGKIRKDGSQIYRNLCSTHHNERIASRHGCKNSKEVTAKKAGFDNVADYKDHVARTLGYANHYDRQDSQARAQGYASYYDKKDKQAIAQGYASLQDKLNQQAQAQGFKSRTDKKNRTHRYLKYRKDHCENTDGRLGFVCQALIVNDCQLDVDHIDGNSENNDPINLQTLCKNCHSVKTLMYKDYKTPGRKTIRQQKLQASNSV